MLLRPCPHWLGLYHPPTGLAYSLPNAQYNWLLWTLYEHVIFFLRKPNRLYVFHRKVGTPYYLSPELCENRPYNMQSDMWSLVCGRQI